MEMFESGRPVTEQCPSCGRTMDAQARPFRKVSGFLRFLLSLAPGVGHLYMGLMRRGMQLLIGSATVVFVLAIALGPYVILGFWLLVAFSVFDAREAHLRMEQGLDVEDAPLIRVKNLEVTYNHKFLAYGLIGVGGLIFYAQFVRPVLQRMVGWYFSSQIDGALFGLGVLAAGVYLLMRQRKH